MTYIANFKKYCYISDIFLAKPENFVIFAFSYVVCRFWLELIVLTANEAMKPGDEALNASSLQYLKSVKYFIASLLRF